MEIKEFSPPNIISASRRTDIPAFYTPWLINRIREGFACTVNPFNGDKYKVSLLPEDVICFVFWSKNFGRLIPSLHEIKELGYGALFHFTITGLPDFLERNVISTEEAINQLIDISNMFSPEHIFWRFDPIVLSNELNASYYINKFREIASKLKGYTRKCYISFVMSDYRKVAKQFHSLAKTRGWTFYPPTLFEMKKISQKIAVIAMDYNMEVFACCIPDIVGGNVRKARCIDSNLVQQLYPEKWQKLKISPTRKDCGCYLSRDIGMYDSCLHDCIYCYANSDKERAYQRYNKHNADNCFLIPV